MLVRGALCLPTLNCDGNSSSQEPKAAAKPMFRTSFARLLLCPEAPNPCQADSSASAFPQLQPSPSSARSGRDPGAGGGPACRRLVAAPLPSVGTDRNGGGHRSLVPLLCLLLCRAAAPGLGTPEAVANPRSQRQQLPSQRRQVPCADPIFFLVILLPPSCSSSSSSYPSWRGRETPEGSAGSGSPRSSFGTDGLRSPLSSAVLPGERGKKQRESGGRAGHGPGLGDPLGI